MTRLKQAIGACMLASTFLPAVSAYAATYYVATTGSDSNPGASSSPWRTVRYAVSKMVAGDTTYVRGGTYNESGIQFKRSGTSAAPIKLLNAPGQFPIINCISNSFNNANMVLFQNSTGYKNAIGWITLEGFEIRNCYSGINFYNLHDSVIRRNWVHHNNNQGIYGNGTRIVLDRNRINHNGRFATAPTSILEHGIYMNGRAMTVTNNLIYDNLAYGITLNGTSAYDPNKHAGPEFAASDNWIIANNTFAYNVNRAGIVHWGSHANNTRIENNIFYENAVTLSAGASQGVEFWSGYPTGVTIRNNHAYASGSGGQVFITSNSAAEGTHYTQSGNVVNVSNPAFVNAPAELPASPNFSLTAQSPAIDKGLPLAETRTAFDGTLRPQGCAYDIGAYEFELPNRNCGVKRLSPPVVQIR